MEVIVKSRHVAENIIGQLPLRPVGREYFLREWLDFKHVSI